MSEFKATNKKALSEWSTVDVANHLKKSGLQRYGEMFHTNNIDGTIASSMNEEHLKEMGVDNLGDRLKIVQILDSLKKAKQNEDDNEVLWKGKEVLYSSNTSWCFSTLCGLCNKQSPASYTLTRKALEIKKTNKKYCGPIDCSCMCATGYDKDNVDLSKIIDVDVQGKKAACGGCGSYDIEYIIIKADNTKELRVLKSESKVALPKIRAQVDAVKHKRMIR